MTKQPESMVATSKTACQNDIIKSKIILKVSAELTDFANSLKPSEEYIKNAKAKFQKIFQRLEIQKELSLDRRLFGGSVGKNTSVLFPDFDLVVFLNDKRPPFKQTVYDIKDILTVEAESFEIIPKSIKASGGTVTLEFEDGVEMDLLPACCFSQKEDEQYDKVMQELKSYPEKYISFSSSLADVQIKFLTKQPGTTNQLIRLIKYYYKTLTLDEEVHGGSYMMEVICVAVCHEHAKHSSKSVPLLKNFKSALAKLSRFSTLKIVFKRLEEGVWKLLDDDEIKNHLMQYNPAILQRHHFIMDPSNPYNDLAKNVSDAVVLKLEQGAAKMLFRVEMLEKVEEENSVKTVKNIINSKTLEVNVKFDKLFEPISLSLANDYPSVGIPKSIVLHCDYQSHSSPRTKIFAKTDAFFVTNKDAKLVTKAIETKLTSLIRGKARRDGNKHVFVEGLPDVTSKDEVEKAVKLLLDQNFEPSAVKKCPSNSEHNKCDVTLYIPYRCKVKKSEATNWAVRLSMKW